MARICVIDYKKGNLASVQRGLADAGHDAFVSTEPSDILNADGIVLPGVGSFADAMGTMNELGQSDAIRKKIASGAPFLGICLGLQLLYEWGDEGAKEGERIDGLGLIEGHVERMPAIDSDGIKHKVPHVGWNTVDFARSNPLFDGVADHEHFYFTHSYVGIPDNSEDILATTTHAAPFACALQRDNIYATQFHPEKSSTLGMRVLSNFGSIVERASKCS